MPRNPAATNRAPQKTTAEPANPTCKLRSISRTTHIGWTHSEAGENSDTAVRENSGSARAYTCNVKVAQRAKAARAGINRAACLPERSHATRKIDAWAATTNSIV